MRCLVVSLLLCASAALAQASAVKIVDPSDQTKQANVKAVGSERALTVRCVEGCASTINLGDAGISITADSWFPDGGSIGYMRMPDGGALEVYVTGGIAGGGGWVPDGGYVGTVGQGPGEDGGRAWNVQVLSGLVDQGNSTSTPLAGGGVFTGTATATSATSLSVIAYSNVSSAAGGLSIEGSTDGTNWDHTHTHTVTGGAEFIIGLPIQTKYVRIVYTNGGSAQGVFRLQTILHATSQTGSVVSVNDTPTATDHAQLTQAVIIGQTTAGGGAYVPVKVNPSGTLTVAATQDTSPWVVSAASLPLPTGAATAANQTTLGSQTTKLNDGTDTALITGAGALVVDGSGVTQPVSAASLPLPTGASTSALQTTGNTSLSNIDTDLDVALSTRLSEASFTGRFPASATLADATANPSLSASAGYLMAYNGTTWDRLRKSATGLLVDIQNTSLAVTQSGTWNVGLSAGTNYIGKTRLTDGTLDMSLLNSAPGSDTGQVSVPVRIISSLAGGAGGTSSSFGATFPATGTAAGFSDGTNMQTGRVFDADTGAGNQYVLGTNLRVSASGGSVEAAAGSGTVNANTLRVVLPTDQPVIPVSDNGSSLTVDGTVAVSNSFLLDATFTGRFSLGAAAADNFANPTTTGTLGFNMLWDGATWDRAPGNSTDGTLVNLGANNDVTVTGTVTANAGTGTFTVGQATAANLRAQTASESSTAAAIPTVAGAVGMSDGTNLQIPRLYDFDSSGGGTLWGVVTGIGGSNFGGVTIANVEEVVPKSGAAGVYVWDIPKDVFNPVTTAVSCATTATAAPASILTNRKTLTVINNSTATIYLGGSAVTTSTGIPLLPGASFMDDVSNATYYCIVTSGTADLRVLEN